MAAGGLHGLREAAVASALVAGFLLGPLFPGAVPVGFAPAPASGGPSGPEPAVRGLTSLSDRPAAVPAAVNYSNLTPNWANDTINVSAGPETYDPNLSTAFDPAENCTIVYDADFSFGTTATWKLCDGNWTRLHTGLAPPIQSEVCMAYDPLDQYIVFFGGGPYALVNETWTFANDSWSNISATAHAPSPRAFSTCTWDRTDGYLLLFGGWSGSKSLGDTWGFVHGAWTKLNAGGSSSSPPAAYDDSLVFDAVLNTTLLLDGQSISWAWSNGSWSKVSVPDPAGASIGLSVESAGGGVLTHASDGWKELRGRTWVALASSPPGNGGYYGLVYDPTDPSDVLIVLSSAGWSIWRLPGALTTTIASSVGAQEIGRPVPFVANASGGWGNLTFGFPGAPAGAGCVRVGPEQLTCTPTAAGTYVIPVVVTDAAGNSSTSSATLVSLPGPQLSSVALLPNATDVGGTPVTFEATPRNGTGPLRWAWTGLPPGCDPATPPLTCSPLVAGSYNVSVAVTDADNNTVQVGFPALQVHSGFTALVSSTPLSGAAPWNVSFAIDPSGGTDPFAWAWAFGDGTTSTAMDPVHRYADPGRYSVQLHGSDAAGEAINWTGTAVVGTSFTVQLRAGLTATEVGVPFSVTATASNGSYPTGYLWSGLPAGCGPTNLSSLTCSATVAGDYNISVAATGLDGARAGAVVEVHVAARLAAALVETEGASNCSSVTVSFIGSTAGGVGPITNGWTVANSSSLNTSASFVESFARGDHATRVAVTYVATDARGVMANASTSLMLLASDCTPSSGSGTSSVGGGIATDALLGAAAAGLIGLGFVLARAWGARRRPGP